MKKTNKLLSMMLMMVLSLSTTLSSVTPVKADVHDDVAPVFTSVSVNSTDLNVGDELIYEIEDDKILFKTKDGKLLGTNTLPRIDEATGIKTMKIANFVYDLDKTSDGHITSKLKKMAKKINEILSGGNITLKKIQQFLSLFYTDYYSKTDDAIDKQVLKDINDIVKAATKKRK